jgi:hypothetical protein
MRQRAAGPDRRRWEKYTTGREAAVMVRVPRQSTAIARDQACTKLARPNKVAAHRDGAARYLGSFALATFDRTPALMTQSQPRNFSLANLSELRIT